MGGYHTSSSISGAPSPSGQKGTYLININDKLKSLRSTGGGCSATGRWVYLATKTRGLLLFQDLEMLPLQFPITTTSVQRFGISVKMFKSAHS